MTDRNGESAPAVEAWKKKERWLPTSYPDFTTDVKQRNIMGRFIHYSVTQQYILMTSSCDWKMKQNQNPNAGRKEDLHSTKCSL